MRLFPNPINLFYQKKPDKLGYRNSFVKFKHYGRNVELLIKKAMLLPTKEEQIPALIEIGKLMKGFYVVWNRENVSDAVILENIEEMVGDTDTGLREKWTKNPGIFGTSPPHNNARENNTNEVTGNINRRGNNNSRKVYKKRK